MIDMDLNQVKQLYCKYRCNLKDQKIFTCIEDGDVCSECHADIDIYYEGMVAVGDNACKICQWENVINELKEFNLIKK